MKICANCKYCGLIESPSPDFYASNVYIYCCTNDNFQKMPYISPVSGQKITPPQEIIYCEDVNEGKCPHYKAREKSDGPLKVLNETKLSWGCIFGIFVLALIIAGLFYASSK